MTKNIILLGYMGCGKSTLGRSMAESLQMNFIDLDNYIEKRYFKSIEDIFKEYGESIFRERESQCLAEILEFQNSIIATGGGAPCFNNNIDLIKRSGISIYIKVSEGDLSERLRLNSNSRPLIKGKSRNELIHFITTNIALREQYYNQADHIVIANNDTVADDIIKILP